MTEPVTVYRLAANLCMDRRVTIQTPRHYNRERTCPHCGIKVRGGVYFRWHGYRCAKRGNQWERFTRLSEHASTARR